MQADKIKASEIYAIYRPGTGHDADDLVRFCVSAVITSPHDSRIEGRVLGEAQDSIITVAASNVLGLSDDQELIAHKRAEEAERKRVISERRTAAAAGRTDAENKRRAAAIQGQRLLCQLAGSGFRGSELEISHEAVKALLKPLRTAVTRRYKRIRMTPDVAQWRDG